MLRTIVVALIACLALLPAAVEACSVIAPEQPPSPARKHREARLLIRHASAIIDGEVVRPFIRGKQNGLVRPHRVFKGPRRGLFEVEAVSSCDRALDAAGERLRMVLFDGPEIYVLPREGADSRYVDRLLGSDRRKHWPYFQGTQAPSD